MQMMQHGRALYASKATECLAALEDYPAKTSILSGLGSTMACGNSVRVPTTHNAMSWPRIV